MNYIAGYLYLMFKDDAEAYKAFHILMNKYFKTLFLD